MDESRACLFNVVYVLRVPSNSHHVPFIFPLAEGKIDVSEQHELAIDFERSILPSYNVCRWPAYSCPSITERTQHTVQCGATLQGDPPPPTEPPNAYF